MTDALSRREVVERALLAIAGVTSVLPLLLWTAGVMGFRSAAIYLAAPTLTVATLLAVVSPHRHTYRAHLRVAAFAGVVGTLGYDIFRIPFVVLAEMRLLDPISSYGVLLLNRSGSSPLSDFVGWIYHFTNGVGFAFTYIVLSRGTYWQLGVVWAMVLETATVVTPFSQAYGLEGKYGTIAVAYLAHIPYGLALGYIGQAAISHRLESGLPDLPAARNVAVALVCSLAVWLGPWRGGEAARIPLISEGRLIPTFVHVRDSDCTNVTNTDQVVRTVRYGTQPVVIEPSATAKLCNISEGVSRLRATGQRGDGGFLIRSMGERNE